MPKSKKTKNSEVDMLIDLKNIEHCLEYEHLDWAFAILGKYYRKAAVALCLHRLLNEVGGETNGLTKRHRRKAVRRRRKVDDG